MNVWMRKIRILLLVLIMITIQLGLIVPNTNTVEAADNGLGAKPYMGWSSYSMQVYSGNGQWITADNVKAQSDAMHTTLQPYGYEYINIDAAWNGGMDGYGRPIPSTTLYPDGFQDVIDHIHNNGQKVGIYGIPGLSPQAYEDDLPIYGAPGCSMQDIAAQPLRSGDYWGLGYKIDFSSPCAQSYINSIADLYGEWGIDFLKFDSVTPGSGISDLSLDARDDVKAWSQALEQHHIWLELSWALDINYVDTWKQYANGWRIDWDVECYCGTDGLTTWSSIARLFPKAEQWWRHAGPGGWNDFDSLNVGNGSMDGITQDERQTAMTLWAMSSAPLYIGNDMTNLDSYGIELLTNAEVIAVNQAGRPAHPVSTTTEQQVWYANNGDGSYTVALFNLGSSAATVHVNWSDIGLTGPASVRDLWSHTDLGTFSSGFSSIDLASHDSRLFRVVSSGGSITTNDDDTGVTYTGDWERNGGLELTGGTQNLLIEVTDSMIQNSTINPKVGSFDKKLSDQTDVTATLELNGNELISIMNGETSLELGTDYTLSGNELSIKKEYLAAEPEGTISLIFTFSAGASQTLAIMVSDTSNGIYIPVNDDDAGISYHGAWQRSWSRGYGDYMDDVHYTESNDDFYEYTFTGTGIDLITEMDTSQGDIDIYVDNEFKETISTYHSSRLVQQTVYSITGLPDAVHTLKAVKKSGTFMLLDKLMFNTPDLVTEHEVAINDNDSEISYTGSWGYSWDRGLGDYMDDVHYTENNDDYFEYTFMGTGIDMITELDSSQGDVDIYVDNEFKQTISTYQPSRSVQQAVYSITGLPEATHTLKAVKKSGTYMLLDMLSVSVAAQNSTISPTLLSFDQNTTAQADLTTLLALNGNVLSSITEGTTGLVAGTDYTLTGNQLMIKKEYLATLPTGTINLNLIFSEGADQNLAIIVSNTSLGRSVVINNDDSAIMYSGNWQHGRVRGMGDYKDDVQYTEANNDSFEYTFKGTGIEIITEKDASQGDIDIYVDNEFQQTVSTYNSSRLVQQTVYNITGLSDDYHTIKAVKKSGSYMLLDALRFRMSDLISPDTASFDKSLAHQADVTTMMTIDESNLLSIANDGTDLVLGTDYTVSGSLVTIKKEYLAASPVGITALTFSFRGDYLNDVHYSEMNNDYFEYTFTGTGIEWITAKGPDQGNVDIYVDHKFKQTVSTYHSSRQSGQTVYHISGLPNGTHTIKAVKKSGDYMLVDSLKFTTATPVTVNDTNSKIKYSGSWTHNGERGFGDYEDDVHYTATNKDSFEFKFKGSRVELIMEKDPSQGDIEIYVDNKWKQTISTYHPTRLVQQTVYSLAGLKKGSHKIKVVKKSGSYMSLDSLRVTE